MRAADLAVVKSDAVAEHLAALLWDTAAQLDERPERTAATASTARLARRTARELLALHGVESDPVELFEPAADPDPEQYR